MPAALRLVTTRLAANWLGTWRADNDGDSASASLAATAATSLAERGLTRSSAKPLRLAAATVMLNVSTLAASLAAATKAASVRVIVRALGTEDDADVQFTLLAALGTLVCFLKAV